MKVKIWGARGSLPAPLSPALIREKIYEAIIGLGTIDPTDTTAVRAYVNNLSPLLGGSAGGNTPCVEIRADNDIFIVDAGSGIRELGLALLDGPCGRGEGVVHIFFSHAHWDHIQGFPFFRPAFIPGNRIFIYYVHPYDWHQTVLGEQQRPINFPVPLEVMQAHLKFIQLKPEQTLSIGQVNISTIKMHHPGDSYAFRFDNGQSIFVYASDAEYKSFDEASLRPYIEFFADADVLLFDSQLTLREVTFEKEDWGHSSALIGVDLARRAGVKKLVLFHHDPTHADQELLAIQAQAIEYQAQDTSYPPCEVIVAYEGLTFDLMATKTIKLRRLPDDASILTLTPIFDERSVEEFEVQLTRLSEMGWPARLIIDLSGVESLAVVGLKPLIALRREHPDTLIALVGLSERVRRVIKLAGFLDFFAIYPTLNDILAIPQIRESAGQLLKNRYHLEDKVGESSLGVVYRAIDTQLKTQIAVKILSVSFSPQAIQQFLHQARQIIRLDHPNIVDVLDCDIEDGMAYIAQEFMEGQTLHEKLHSQPEQPLPLEQAIHIGLNIALALEFAHSRGVIHGDLRPQNIFLTRDTDLATLTHIKLTDFGLGGLREGQNLLDNLLVLQYAPYLAPEQILGEPLDARTDLYALGIILYQLVTGRMPFYGSDQVVMQAHLNEPPASPRKFNPQLSRPLEHFILKLLAKDPDERYATAHQTQRVLSNLGLRGTEQSTGLGNISRHQQYPMIGREQPLEALLSAWQQAQTSQGQLLLIAGETGIGKTRLTQEIANLAQAGTLLVGHCHALEGSLAYQPFIEALRTYFATVPPNIADKDVGQLLSNVVRWVPEIRTVMPDLPEAVPLEPRQEQLRLMNSLSQYIERATQEHPWLLILDDLHWADQSSLQLLYYLARHCASMALLIIGTYRDTDLENNHPLLETLHGLRRSPGYQVFVLERLTQIEVEQMLINIWGQSLPALLVEKIYQVTEGNPFYVEEVAKGLVDDGTVKWRDGVWHFSTEGKINLPQSVRDAVLRRINYLNRDTQALLRQAAVLGRTFHFDDLRQMSGLSEWTILEHLDAALERQLVEEAPDETMLRFSHAEIQQVLYQELSTLRRRLLHRQAGEALEVRYLTDPRRMAEELAHHFDEAGEMEKALIYSIQAARHADQAYASQTALMWYGRALKVLNQLGLKESTQVQLFDLLLARERLHGRQGLREEQIADLQAAQEVAQRLNDPTRLARVHNQQSYYYRLVSNYAQATEHAQLALQAARQAKDAVLEGESLNNLAYIEQDQGQYQVALQHMAAAQTILEKTDDRRGEAIALKGLGMLHHTLNQYEQAQAYLEQALAMNQAIGNRRGESACLNNLGEVERDQGNYSAASAYYQQTLGIDQAIGNRSGEAIAFHNLSLVYLALGNYERARAYIGQALPIYHSIEDKLGVAEALHVQSAINYAVARYETAYEDAQAAVEVFQELNHHVNLAAAHLMLGLSLEALNDLRGAYEAYHQAINHWVSVGDNANALDARAGIARCALAQNDEAEALGQIELSLTWLGEHSLTGLDHPFRFYLTAYQVLQATDKAAEAHKILAEAHTLLQAHAAKIADDDLRRSFLENVPQNQAIVAEWAKVAV